MSIHQKLPLLLACSIDLWCGDPPNRYHPVAWMGSWIHRWQQRAPRQGPRKQFLYGTFLTLAGSTLVGGIGLLMQRGIRRLPFPLQWSVEAAILKSTFSIRGLSQASQAVQEALESGELPLARHLVSWHLVSRDTAQLNASQVAAATIESLAENASDGIIAPLLFYRFGGLPAALIYRFVNTCDAMLGYRDAAVSSPHLRSHETARNPVSRLLLAQNTNPSPNFYLLPT